MLLPILQPARQITVTAVVKCPTAKHFLQLRARMLHSSVRAVSTFIPIGR